MTNTLSPETGSLDFFAFTSFFHFVFVFVFCGEGEMLRLKSQLCWSKKPKFQFKPTYNANYNCYNKKADAYSETCQTSIMEL